MARLSSHIGSTPAIGIEHTGLSRFAVVAVAAATVLAVATSCDHQADPVAPSQSTASTVPTGPALAERDALTAYRGCGMPG